MTTPAVALTECLQCIFSQVGRPFCGVEECKFSQTRPATAKAKVNSPQALLPDYFRALKARTIREAAGGRAVKSKQPMASCCRARGRLTGRTRRQRSCPAPAACHICASRLEVAGIFDALLQVLLPRAAGGGRRWRRGERRGGTRVGQQW